MSQRDRSRSIGIVDSWVANDNGAALGGVGMARPRAHIAVSPEALSESDLPYKVDIVDLSTVDPSFKTQRRTAP